MNKTKLCVALAGASLAMGFGQAALASSAAQTYEVVAKYPLGGSEGWDYLAFDGRRGRLFISRAQYVQVMDAKTGALVGNIPDTAGVHGVAFAQNLKLGFTSNGKADTISVFDLDTLAKVDTVKVTGGNPDFILYEPAQKRVYTSNGRTANITAIDAATRKVVATIDVGGRPEAIVSDKEGRHLFVNLEDKNELVKIDAQAGKVVARWSIAACDAPTGLAFDRKHERLFSVCHNAKMVVTDAESGKVVSEVATGRYADAANFDAKEGLVYSSSGEGSLTVVHEDTPDAYTVQGRVATMVGAKTLAVDHKTHRVYLVSAQFGAAPAATAEHPHPRPAIVPDTVTVLVAEPKADK